MDTVTCVDANGNKTKLPTYYQCEMDPNKRTEKSLYGIRSDLMKQLGGVDDLHFMQGNKVVCLVQTVTAALKSSGGSLGFVYKRGQQSFNGTCSFS